MTDHALVVGCDAYPLLPEGDLTSAVADALAMRDWLLGSQIEPMTVTFLASPSQNGVQLGDVVADGPASRSRFAVAVADLIERFDVGVADRLFVYFAGHGCATDPNNPVLAQDALAFTDYTDHDPPANCVGVEDLLRRLQQSRFGTIVVWLDACRDYPFTTAFQLAGLGVDPAPREVANLPALFLGQATQRGGVARGDVRVGGVFTRALLAGLRGDGSAKVYDETDDPPYVVRWSSLQRYLDSKLPDQRPRLRGEGDLVLARYPDGSFDQVTLSIDVTPADAGRMPGLHGSVHFVDPSAIRDGIRRFDGPTPVHLSVPPRRHQVRVEAGELWNKKSVDVYRDEMVTLPLRDMPKFPMPGTPWRGPGRVDVRVDDPAAVVEVRDVRSAVRLAGTGGVQGSLPAGFYDAVLVDPDGHDIAEPVDIEAGHPQSVSLTAPLPDNVPRVADGALRWASGAAIAAAEAMRQVPGSGPGSLIGVLDVLGTRLTLEGFVGDNVLVRNYRSDGVGQVIVAFPSPQEARIRLSIAGRLISVPVLPEAVTGVFLGPNGLEVGLYDRSLHDSHVDMLLLDRVQRLLQVGRRAAGIRVLDALSHRQRPYQNAPWGGVSLVNQALTGLANRFSLSRADGFFVGTAYGADPAVRHRIIGGGLWDVRDETAGTP